MELIDYTKHHEVANKQRNAHVRNDYEQSNHDMKHSNQFVFVWNAHQQLTIFCILLLSLSHLDNELNAIINQKFTRESASRTVLRKQKYLFNFTSSR